MNGFFMSVIMLIAFAGVVIGYAVGRRSGQREGFLEGSAYAPLDLRRKSWERGACIVCGRLAGDRTLTKQAEPTAEPGANVGSVGPY